MLVFWGIAIALLVLTLTLLLFPLLRAGRFKPTDSRTEVLAIYRQQFNELEQDKTSGVLDNQQYELAKSDLGRRLLEDTASPAQSAGQKATAKPFVADVRLAITLLVLVPLLAVGIYLKIGNPQAILTTAEPLAEQASDVKNIENILQSLRERLEKDPADGAGWALLARGYAKLQRFDEAAIAYGRAVKIIPDDANLLADYAVALAVLQDRKLEGKPEELVNQALKIDPNAVKPLMLGASAAFDRKDYQTAITYWERVQKQLPENAEEAQKSIAAAIERAQGLAAGKAQPSAPKD